MMRWLTCVLCLAFSTVVQAEDSEYVLGPDSQRQEGVPKGTVTEHVWKSKIFEGTIRRYWVYVPTQYSAEKPVALMVFQDGHTYVKEDGKFRAPVVMDNLIHKKEMPVTIGIFIDPGHKKEQLPEKPGWQPSPRDPQLRVRHAVGSVREVPAGGNPPRGPENRQDFR